MEWHGLIKKMDGKGPPIKKQRLTNPNMSKKLCDINKPSSNSNQNLFDVILPYFDIQHHGYFLCKGELYYKQPDGKRLKATGVDSFPDIFPDPPKNSWNNQFNQQYNSHLRPPPRK
jgi:hypothetical protein